ncbi:MAG: hypothetical protein IEMM0008_0275 [bacterium]|nr:MAG: hypothetical protein IEMM0008_0275 [bacterium]
MPEISRFLGIVISINYNDHSPPHFHVKYNEHRAMFSIKSLELIEGFLPKRIVILVLEWGYDHRDDLMENWNLAQAKQPLKKIEPLI